MTVPLEPVAGAIPPWRHSTCPMCGRASEHARHENGEHFHTVFHRCHQGHGWSIHYCPELEGT